MQIIQNSNPPSSTPRLLTNNSQFESSFLLIPASSSTLLLLVDRPLLATDTTARFTLCSVHATPARSDRRRLRNDNSAISKARTQWPSASRERSSNTDRRIGGSSPSFTSAQEQARRFLHRPCSRQRNNTPGIHRFHFHRPNKSPYQLLGKIYCVHAGTRRKYQKPYTIQILLPQHPASTGNLLI